MKIDKNCVVELDYKLMDLQDQVWESSDEGGPWVYLHGHGELMPALEKELIGKGIGQSRIPDGKNHVEPIAGEAGYCARRTKGVGRGSGRFSSSHRRRSCGTTARC